MNKIDFVVTWVDGSDEKWLKEKNKYKADKNQDASNTRYRDYEIIKYFFRSVEKYAPWVNKIYFITWGHVPKWLNSKNPKLVIVKHKDFIPKKYLPTFNSCAIELNMHRIKDLSETFVYFNDDIVLNNYTKEKDFFENGYPKDSAVFNAIIPYGKSNFEHRLVNNSNLINRNFNMMSVIKRDPFKWFNFKYGSDLIRTFCLLSWKKFSTIKQYHIPISFFKSTFNKVWQKEEEVMDISCKDKFRSFFGVNPWAIKDWQICEGKFMPRSYKFGKLCTITNNNEDIYKELKRKKYKVLCLNDTDSATDFDKIKKELTEELEKKFPDKSSFEK